MPKKEVMIVEACRTPVGRFGGALKDLSAPQLGGLAIAELLKRSGLSGDEVDWVLMGIADPNGVGEVPARHAALMGGLPQSVPAMTFSAACTSALYAVNTAWRLIAEGDADVVIAGGMESMTNNPHLLYGARFGLGYGDTKLVDGTKLALTCPVGDVQMGVYGDIVSQEQGVTRADMDDWALLSQQRYREARAAGKFDEEIFSVEVRGKKGPAIIADDEPPRPDVTLEALAKLKPAFSPEGMLTAGNSPGICDGAGCVLLMASEIAEAKGIRPLASIISRATVAHDPKNIPIVPALTARKALDRAGIALQEVDLFELNEAFAAVTLISMRMLGIEADRVNVNGGAVAIGHPVGFTGVRILMTLAYELGRRGGGIGVASLCGVGSQGEATVIKV